MRQLVHGEHEPYPASDAESLSPFGFPLYIGALAAPAWLTYGREASPYIVCMYQDHNY